MFARKIGVGLGGSFVQNIVKNTIEQRIALCQTKLRIVERLADGNKVIGKGQRHKRGEEKATKKKNFAFGGSSCSL